MNGKVLERYAELMIDKIRQMSAGEWQKPWFTPRTGLPQNISGRPYNSMNRLMLYMEMDRMGYTLPVFMTFRQLKNEKPDGHKRIARPSRDFLRYHREA